MTNDLREALEPLKDCPFCGGSAQIRESATCHDTWFVRCTECQCKTVTSYTKYEPTVTWNARAALAQPAPAGREITDAMVNAGAGVLWNDRDARMGGPWKGRGADEVCVIQTKATMRAALQAALSLSPHNGGSEEERELFAAATKIDLAGALMHIRDWRSYIDDHHRQKYADLIEAQAKLVSLLIAKRSVAAPPPPVADREPSDAHPVLKHADELHALGFKAGWEGVIEECANIAEAIDTRRGNEKQIAAVIRSLAPNGPAAGWQPIETAPKDGSSIMLFALGSWSCASWNGRGHWNLEVNRFTLGYDGGGEIQTIAPAYAVAWAPMPPDPTVSRADRGTGV